MMRRNSGQVYLNLIMKNSDRVRTGIRNTNSAAKEQKLKMKFNLKYSCSKMDFTVLQKPSVVFLVFAACFSIWFVDFWRSWHLFDTKDSPFVWDVVGYYSYLPATFHHDYSFEFGSFYDPFLFPSPL